MFAEFRRGITAEAEDRVALRIEHRRRQIADVVAVGPRAGWCRARARLRRRCRRRPRGNYRQAIFKDEEDRRRFV